MNERYFVACQDEDGSLIFATHGYFGTRTWAESYARTLSPASKAMVIKATADFYARDAHPACGG